MLKRILDLIFTRHCSVCGTRLTGTEKAICMNCNITLPRSMQWREPKGNMVAQRFWGMGVERAAAYMEYDSQSAIAHIFHNMKYHHNKNVAREMGRMMAREMSEAGYFDGIDCIVPVPLTRSRQRTRGYNQSEILARGISDITGTRVRTDILKREHFSGSQTRLTAMERAHNVKDAFALGNTKDTAGKHILLIDDIITTGATTRACVKELKNIDNVKVSVVALGFVKN